jgi:hypothetical protein
MLTTVFSLSDNGRYAFRRKSLLSKKIPGGTLAIEQVSFIFSKISMITCFFNNELVIDMRDIT